MFLIQVDIDYEELDELVNKVVRDGGSLVLYQHVYSIGPITWLDDVFDYVPPGRSAFLPGLKHSFICLLVGLWALTGPVFVLHALFINLSGGIRTAVYVSGEDGVEQRLKPEAILLCERKRELVGFLWALSLLAGAAVMLWLAIRTYY